MTQEEAYFTVKEVAQYFKITEKFVRAEIGRGRLIANKFGGEWRISREDRDKYEILTRVENRSKGDLAPAC
jgi:excisionase family DNA binding protein